MQSKCKLTESTYMPFFHQDSLTFSNYAVCKSLWKQKTNSRQNKHKGLPTRRKTKLNYLKPAIRNTNHQRWILDKQYALWILITASSWVQKAWRSLKQRHRVILRNVHGNKKRNHLKSKIPSHCYSILARETFVVKHKSHRRVANLCALTCSFERRLRKHALKMCHLRREMKTKAVFASAKLTTFTRRKRKHICVSDRYICRAFRFERFLFLWG